MRRTFSCHAARAALLPALLGGCVSGSTSRPPRPPPPPSPAVVSEFGYEDVVQYGEQLARQQGYDVREVEAVLVGRNLWRVRFGLGPQGSGKFLELDFDAASRKLVKSIELQEVSRELLPGPPLGTLADSGVTRPELLPGADGGPLQGPGRSPVE